jgi:hypothetical protein
LRDIEAGRLLPSSELARMIAAELNIDPDELRIVDSEQRVAESYLAANPFADAHYRRSVVGNVRGGEELRRLADAAARLDDSRTWGRADRDLTKPGRPRR